MVVDMFSAVKVVVTVQLLVLLLDSIELVQLSVVMIPDKEPTKLLKVSIFVTCKSTGELFDTVKSKVLLVSGAIFTINLDGVTSKIDIDSTLSLIKNKPINSTNFNDLDTTLPKLILIS